MSTFKNMNMVLIFLGIVSASAFAATKTSSDTENDALAVASNKVTLTQAISAAEQNVNGQAIKAKFSTKNTIAVYNVEVVKNKEVYDVKVDAQSGAVLSSSLDKTDNSSEEDSAE